ncbi:MAG: outer membrane beta-barrel protein [Deltaproteobacteria bacterium]|nr:outer membrane beta-barrel protein [Deltaproteobacteria bacterium]
MKKLLVVSLTVFAVAFGSPAFARSSKNMTIGIMAMGNIQLIDTIPDIDPGPGGGVYFDYRFNQRFSITIDAWATTHGGNGPSNGDEGIEFLGIPTFTIKLYFMDDEGNKWDPFAGLGLGVFALSEGSVENSTNGIGLGGQLEVGFDYHFTNVISAGFSGVFRSAAIITSLENTGGNNSSGMIPFSLVGRVGFHF